MSKRLFMTMLLTACFTLTFAQDYSKLSATTQMFLDEMNGKLSFARNTASEKALGLVRVDEKQKKNKKEEDRLFAHPDTIDGKVYISSFIRLDDSNNTSKLEAIGVVVQERLTANLITALIPVDKIGDVSEISDVRKIKVAQLMRKTTNAAREKTNTDDVLTHSADAINAGITKAYDGTGVVLGVIDTGIDFQHISFKDKNGNSRIKRSYVYNGSRAQEYTSITSSSPTTDDKAEDHGTHTSTTAGGSSVIVNGNNVTVTDNHASASYGGMAPGADLYLAGINSLSDTYMSNAIKKICDYADAQEKPVVVSNSWGSQFGPHDGTGEWADFVNQYFSDSHPNHICLFASSNDGGYSKDGEGGGYHVSGTASSGSPLSSILRSNTYINTDAGYFYQGVIANAWSRTALGNNKLAVKIHVLDASTGSVLKSVTMTSQGSVSGLSSYYTGSLYVYFDYIDSNKSQVLLYSSDGIKSTGVNNTTQNGEAYYKSKYTLAIQVYPATGSCTVDVWGGNFGYFTNHLTTNGYNWKSGSDDMSVSDEATIPDAISIGAYVSKNRITNYSGTNYNYSGEYTMGDIAGFSSYATAAESPTGIQYPWITAPGARLVAGVNHYHTASVDDYSYYGGDYNYDLVVNSSTSPYAAMEGTSMATPTAAGIVALWLQAAHESGKTCTTSYIKEVMRETAIQDNFTTTGSNASHFGHGKIDALAGIQYILGVSGGPFIKTNPAEVVLEGGVNRTYSQTITVQGFNLEGNVTATLNDATGLYSIDKTNITQSQAENGVQITITWTPATVGTTTASITFRTNGADDLTVNITGEAKGPYFIADPEEISFSANLGETATRKIDVLSEYLNEGITLTLNDPSGVFTLDKTSISVADSEEGAEANVSFSSDVEGSYTGSITLSSPGAEDVVITLTATASDGGTASDAYLNIARYSTIDEAGWSTTYVNKLYSYTEYPSTNTAWLTLPVYGAWSAVYYDHPQKWIESGNNNSNTYSGVTWNASSPLLGSSTYFTGSSGAGSARGFGYNSRTNTSIRNVTFYVTNTTAVKLYGTGRNGSNSSYPASLKIYECTKNADGTLTAGNTTVKDDENSGTTTFTLTADGLRTDKIYKVDASIFRGYLYEIGFETPLAADPAIAVSTNEMAIETNVNTTATGSVQVSGTNLTSGITATLTDAAGVFSIDTESISQSEASAGKNINVTFSPVEARTYNATLTLTSDGAETVTVSITGTAHQPAIVAEPAEIAMESEAQRSSTAELTILGEYLNDDVTLLLNDPNNVFSLSSTTVAKTSALEGEDVTITFAPQQQGTYQATITVESADADPVTVTLNGTATKYIPDYYDITISSYGVSTMYLDFPVEIPYDEYDPDLLGVYIIYEYDSEHKDLKLARLNSSIPANTGVVIQANTGTYRFPRIAEASPLKRTNLLSGTVEKITVAKALEGHNSDIVMTLGKGSNGYIGFYQYSGKTLSAYKAYFIPEGFTANEIKSLSINGLGKIDEDDVPTSIKVIDLDEQDGDWWSLQGLRLNRRPSQPGIYIHNGKKVLIK